MAFTAYTEQTLLKLLFGATAYTAVATYYVGLSYTDPSSSITEPTTGGYARQAYTNSGGFNAPVVDSTNGGYKVTNANAITFPTATANWVNGANTNLAYFFIMDGNSGTPNMIASGALGTAKAVNNGDTASFAAGSLSITLN